MRYDMFYEATEGILTIDQSGTSGGNRTHTLVKEADFESAASTNSATLALLGKYPKTGRKIMVSVRYASHISAAPNARKINQM